MKIKVFENKNLISFLRAARRHTNHRNLHMHLNIVITSPSYVVLVFQFLSVSYRLYFLHQVSFEHWIKRRLTFTPLKKKVWCRPVVIPFAVRKWCMKRCFVTGLYCRPFHFGLKKMAVHRCQTEMQPRKTGGEKI